VLPQSEMNEKCANAAAMMMNEFEWLDRHYALTVPKNKEIKKAVARQPDNVRKHPPAGKPVRGKKIEERRSVQAPIPEPDDPEKRAARDLKIAKLLQDGGKVEAAKDKLQRIIEKFPDTEAASEAKALLQKW